MRSGRETQFPIQGATAPETLARAGVRGLAVGGDGGLMEDVWRLAGAPARRDTQVPRPHQKARVVSVGPSSSVKPASVTLTGRVMVSHCSRLGTTTRTR